MTFSVLHIKDNRPLIEPTVDHSGSHVKWRVTSLSPVGPIIQTSQSIEHHGVVLIYKQLCSDNNNFSFHVYLATNSSSEIKVSFMSVTDRRMSRRTFKGAVHVVASFISFIHC